MLSYINCQLKVIMAGEIESLKQTIDILKDILCCKSFGYKCLCVSKIVNDECKVTIYKNDVNGTEIYHKSFNKNDFDSKLVKFDMLPELLCHIDTLQYKYDFTSCTRLVGTVLYLEITLYRNNVFPPIRELLAINLNKLEV